MRTRPRAADGTLLPDTAPPPWQAPYLNELVESCGQIVKSCKRAKVSRSVVYDRRQSNAEFEKLELAALAQATITAESEAKRRAVEGVKTIERRTWTDKDGREHKIERIETKYSDTILLRLLEKQETGSWRQKVQMEHSGGLTFKTRAERKEALEKARAALQQSPVTAIHGRS